MNKEALQKSIVLNGPVGSGKSLLARELSSRLGYPIVSTDMLRHLVTSENLESHHPDYLRQLREFLPNVRNYSQMGFKPKVSAYIEKKFGKTAWHFYQKQFETLLLKEIVENIECPVILDLGGGMGISLDENYKKLDMLSSNQGLETWLVKDNRTGKLFVLKETVPELTDIYRTLQSFTNKNLVTILETARLDNKCIIIYNFF